MKKLNLAFIWHFHQPNYQENYESDFLLPWVRLHCSKDYLSMLKKMDKYKKLKLNFNFSPILLSNIQKYINGAKDLHLRVLLKDKDELNDDDKLFILNNYFDLNYKNMVLTRQYYTSLYNKRANSNIQNLDIFSPEQYCDIMANYTLLWIDKSFIKDYPVLEYLFDKEKGYTLEDRKDIYKIQLDIMRRILIEYKEYQDKNKIEISTSPFYHPVLPLLFNFDDKEIKDFQNLPINFNRKKDAQKQIDMAIDKYAEIFNTKPKGMWLSEQCVCSNSINLLTKNNIDWTVLDDGILAKTLEREFARNYDGNLENPFDLNINYKISKKQNGDLNILFADSFFANLLNFGYGNYEPKLAANDMYEKIKTIQSKLQNSPQDSHILTIALDGENCWESYQNNGQEFLDTLYSLISNDETIETVLVDNYVAKNKAHALHKIKSGSWINRNFDLWIGEPTKNIAWLYLSTVCDEFEIYCSKLKKEDLTPEIKEKIEKAYREILISQGSDWYWWYGEPNESNSDSIFDLLFRGHLINVYKFLDLTPPQYLTIPLSNATKRPLRTPSANIYPSLSGKFDDISQWQNAGLIFIPDGPTSNISRLIKKIHYGANETDLFFRFELNSNSTKLDMPNLENQIVIYFINEKNENFSPIRYVSKNEIMHPIIKNQFSDEIRFVFNKNKISRIFYNRATKYSLWNQMVSKNSDITYNQVIELKLSMKDLNIDLNELSFCVIDVTNELINEVYPQDCLIRF